MTKEMTRISSEYQSLSRLTVGRVRREGVLFVLTPHRCLEKIPFEDPGSFLRVRQPILLEGKEDECVKATDSALCWKSKGTSMKDKILQDGIVGEQKGTVDLQSACLQHTACFPVVFTLHFYSMNIAFCYYWFIVWGVSECWGGKEGKWAGSSLLKFRA